MIWFKWYSWYHRRISIRGGQFLIKESHAINQKFSIINNSTFGFNIPAGCCFVPGCRFHSRIEFEMRSNIKMIHYRINIRQNFISWNASKSCFDHVIKSHDSGEIDLPAVFYALPIRVNSLPIFEFIESKRISSTFSIGCSSWEFVIIPGTTNLASFF